MLNYIDLFSGIGGFAYALRLAGISVHHHFYSEIDPYAIKVYKKHFPEAVALGDVRKIDYQRLRRECVGDWLITGGFPCQDISCAGKRRGINAERSGLWWELHRAIAELRPVAALVENVPALTNHGLERVLCSLAEARLDAEWDCIPACSVGAPHKRERFWLVAYRHRNRLPTRSDQQSQGRRDLGDNHHFITPHKSEDTWSNWENVAATGVLHAQPGVLRVADGLPGWLDRIAACGNAIVPQVAAGILERMKVLL